MTGASDAFGGLLRHYRLAAGLSQEALAAAARLSKRGISDLERGRRRAPYPTTVRRLADALHLDEPGRARLLAARATRPAREGVQSRASTQLPELPRHTQLPELPRELTSFVGREPELRDLARQLAESGLVTIAGPGGAGKTRLALRLAHQLLDQGALADGVVLVDLAPLSEPALVVEAIAASVGTPEPHGMPSVEVLVRFLRTRELLLLLDNCEHLLDACAEAASQVRRSCPGVRLLATSREPLHVQGEVVFRIPPLGLPDDDGPTSLADSEAGQLFIQRAKAADSRFVLDDVACAAVAAISRRLDGQPLAIELAAARIADLPPTEIAARLDDALRVVGRGPRDAPPRQQTLEATLAWSYVLLDEHERRLFRRLAVFAGGFSLDGVQAMADEQLDVLGTLSGLVAKSIVQVEPQASGPFRYRLLEPLRQFAHARLVEAGELADAQRTHADGLLSLAERDDGIADLPSRTLHAPHLDAEHDNIRAAIEWALATPDAVRAARFGAALWLWWARPDRQSQGRALLERILALPGVEEGAYAHSRVMVGLAYLRLTQGDLLGAAQLANKAITQATGDDWLAGVALGVLGTAEMFRGDLSAAEAALRRSVQRVGTTSPNWVAAVSTASLGQLALGRGDLQQAGVHILESNRLASGLDPWTKGMALVALGDLRRTCAEHEAARRAYEEALELFQSLDPVRRYTPHGMLHNLGYVAMAVGHVRRAAALFLESGEIYRTVGADRRGLAECVVGLACTAVRAGQLGLAARLFGSVEATLARLTATFASANRADYERGLAALAARATEAQIATERAIGRGLSLEQALEQAATLTRESLPPKRPAPPGGHDVLTAREREVAVLLARGLSNRGIAEQLVITPKTAANHVQRVLDKLGAHSRAEVAARAEELCLRGSGVSA